MIVMGIESSCDETAVSVIERGPRNRVLAEQIKSQIDLHADFGGVVPEIASRSHYEAINLLAEKALAEAGLTISKVDIVAATQGPGLIGSLLIGFSFAKALAYKLNRPLVPVDHVASHIESAFIEQENIEYPLLALVVSGGHTSLFLQTSKFERELLAKTRDDAVGEVLDKVARYFSLGYPGGPILDRMFSWENRHCFRFTQPRMSDGSNDFSFSGYKSAVLRLAKKQKINSSSSEFNGLISSFVYSLVKYLLKKTKTAAGLHSVKTVVVAGGVSRNSLLRKLFAEEFLKSQVALHLPRVQYCTDNAAMIAWMGYEIYKNFPDRDYKNLNLNVYSRAFPPTESRHR